MSLHRPLQYDKWQNHHKNIVCVVVYVRSQIQCFQRLVIVAAKIFELCEGPAESGMELISFQKITQLCGI